MRMMKRLFSMVLSIVMAVSMLPAASEEVEADTKGSIGNLQHLSTAGWTEGSITIGYNALKNPEYPTKASSAWGNGNGFYVYLGKFSQDTKGLYKEPIKWRVLNTSGDSNEDGMADSIFLMSDKLLYYMPFNESNEDGLVWQNSNMRAWLNSELFTGNYLQGGFLDNAFTEIEKNAINNTTDVGAVITKESASGVSWVWDDKPITGDKMFILGVSDIENHQNGFYGTFPTDSYSANASVVIEPTAYVYALAGSNSYQAYYVGTRTEADLNAPWLHIDGQGDGKINSYTVPSSSSAIAPACNLSRDSILYMRSASEKNTYELVLKDTGRNFQLKDMSPRKALAGDKLTFEYEGATPVQEQGLNSEYISGILCKEGETEAGDYQKLKYIGGTEDKNGTVDYELPQGLEKGNYVLHLFSEQSESEGTGCGSPFQSVSITITDPAVAVTDDKSGQVKEFASIQSAAAYAETLNEKESVSITLYSDAEVLQDITLNSNTKLVIPEDITVTIPQGKTLVNNGSIISSGIILNHGVIENHGSLQNDGIITGGIISGAGTYTGEPAEMDEDITLKPLNISYDTDEHPAAAVNGVQQDDIVFYSTDYDETNSQAAQWSRNCPSVKNVSDSGNIAVKIVRNYYQDKILSGTAVIRPKGLEEDMVSDIRSAGYTGEEVIPLLEIKYGNDVLAEGRDYEVAYSDNVECGTAWVYIKGIGNYSGNLNKSFTIKTAQQEFTLSDPGEKQYGDAPFMLNTEGGTGEGEITFHVPEDNGVLKLEGAVATITGTGSVTVTAVKAEDATYAAAVATCEIKIVPRKLDAEEISLEGTGKSYTYTGSAIKPVTVVNKKAEITPDDYSVFYQKNKNAGTASVTVMGKGNYTGTLTGTFEIVKAAFPEGVPDNMTVDYSKRKLSDIELPENWEWLPQQKDILLEEDMSTEATAVYQGEDKGLGNYEAESVTIFVTRMPCTHEDVSKHETRNAKVVTCTSDGYTGDLYCTECNKVIERGKAIPKKGHSFDSGTVTRPATTSRTGVKTYTCTECGRKKTEVIPKISTGKTIKSGNGYYRIKSSSTAEFYKILPGSKKQSLTIAATVKLKGKTYRITSIAKNACKGNKYLKSVTVGKNVSSIGDNAFYGCKNLKKITVKTSALTAKKTGKKVFKGINSKAVIKVPKKKLQAYKKIFKKSGIGSKVKIM